MSYRRFDVSVLRIEQLSAAFRRLTLVSPDLAEVAWAGVDQRVKLVLPAPPEAGDPVDGDWFEWWRALPDELRPPMRTYTLAAHRPEAGEVDIDFAVHGDSGPLSSFALRADVGDRIFLVAPGTDAPPEAGVAWRPGTASNLLCIGDETALPAIRNILRGLSADQSCDVLVEVPDPSDRLPLVTSARLRLDWVVRPAGTPVGSRAEEFLFGAAASPDSPGEPDPELWLEATGSGAERYAWVAGEVAWVNRLRKRLAPAGYGRGNAAFMGYWRAGHPARG
ncbi:MAG: siderophore-interacting protein [Propionibacteriaceae bacterium]|nr:siderophore-interacting protein [Propionibacteriaceae bacterium]